MQVTPRGREGEGERERYGRERSRRVKEEKDIGEAMKSKPAVPRHGTEHTPSPDPRPPHRRPRTVSQVILQIRGGEARRGEGVCHSKFSHRLRT
jgi:hypothetical protein